MPTAFTAQNGATLNQNTHIEVEGCSGTLSFISHSIKKKTLKLSVYVPGAGKLKIFGPGLTSAGKNASGHGALTFTLQQKKGGS